MITADKSEHLGVVFNMQEEERSFQVFSDQHQNQVVNFSLDLEAAIDRMVCDVVRIRCSKILLSPDVYSACADMIAVRSVEDGGAIFNRDKLKVRGVPAERCTSLTGTEYALVPERK